MSCNVITRVWKSKDRGGLRLTLLALADFANDRQREWAWPGMPALVEKAQLSNRQLQRNLSKLEADGKIFVDKPDRQGRGHKTYYLVLVGLSSDEIRARMEYRNLPESVIAATLERATSATHQKGDICNVKRATSVTRKGDIAEPISRGTLIEPLNTEHTDPDSERDLYVPPATPLPQKTSTGDTLKSVDVEKTEPIHRAAPPKPNAVQVASNNPPPPVARPPSAPVPSEPLFEALGVVCFDNRLSHRVQATRVTMEQVLVEVMAAEPDLTPDRVQAFGDWWMRTTHFKDRKRPYLSQVVKSWAEFQGAVPVLTVPEDAVEDYEDEEPYELPPRIVRPPVNEDARSVWGAMLGQLSVQLNKATFNTWLGNLRLVEFSDEEDTWYYVATVPHNYTKDYLEKNLLASMQDDLASTGKSHFKVQKQAVLEILIEDPPDTDVRVHFSRAAIEARAEH